MRPDNGREKEKVRFGKRAYFFLFIFRCLRDSATEYFIYIKVYLSKIKSFKKILKLNYTKIIYAAAIKILRSNSIYMFIIYLCFMFIIIY